MQYAATNIVVVKCDLLKVVASDYEKGMTNKGDKH